MSLTPDRVEVIISGILEEVPENLSLSDTRNLVVELLFGLGLSPKDLPMFMLLVVDAYMGDRVIDQMKKG